MTNSDGLFLYRLPLKSSSRRWNELSLEANRATMLRAFSKDAGNTWGDTNQEENVRRWHDRPQLPPWPVACTRTTESELIFARFAKSARMLRKSWSGRKKSQDAFCTYRQDGRPRFKTSQRQDSRWTGQIPGQACGTSTRLMALTGWTVRICSAKSDFWEYVGEELLRAVPCFILISHPHILLFTRSNLGPKPQSGSRSCSGTSLLQGVFARKAWCDRGR